MGAITRSHSFVSGEKPDQTQWNVDIDQLFSLVTGQLDDANVDYSSADGIMTLRYAQTVTGVKTFTGSYSVPVIIGTTRLWDDTGTGCLRVKRGSNPSSATDGTILMEG